MRVERVAPHNFPVDAGVMCKVGRVRLCAAVLVDAEIRRQETAVQLCRAGGAERKLAKLRRECVRGEGAMTVVRCIVYGGRHGVVDGRADGVHLSDEVTAPLP
jgi:hypothetical protein